MHSLPTPVSGACTGLPSNALYYGSGTSYSLVNAISGTTLNAITAGYNANPTINTCQYRCDSTSGYVWNGTNCIFTNTVLLMNMNNAGLTDVRGKSVSLFGNSTVSNVNSKFGGYSAYFDGNGDYLTIPANNDFVFGTGDFT